MQKRIDNEPVYNGKYLKTEVIFYGGKINTGFHGQNIPKEGFNCVFLSNTVAIDSVCKINQNY